MRRGRRLGGLLLLVPLFCLADGRSAAQAPPSRAFENTVQPLFSKHCVKCHNAKLNTGGLNLEPFDSTASILQHRQIFEQVLRRVEAGEMPPKGSPRPAVEEVTAAVSVIVAEFERADLPIKPEARILARRLNRTEYTTRSGICWVFAVSLRMNFLQMTPPLGSTTSLRRCRYRRG